MRKSILVDIRDGNFDPNKSAGELDVTTGRIYQIRVELAEKGLLRREGRSRHYKYSAIDRSDIKEERTDIPNCACRKWLSIKAVKGLRAIRNSESGFLTEQQLCDAINLKDRPAEIKFVARLISNGFVSIEGGFSRLTDAGREVLEREERIIALHEPILAAIDRGDQPYKIAKDLHIDSYIVYRIISHLEKEGKILHKGRSYLINDHASEDHRAFPKINLQLSDTETKFLKTLYSSDLASLSSVQLTGTLPMRDNGGTNRVGKGLESKGYVTRIGDTYALTDAGRVEAQRQMEYFSESSSKRRYRVIIRAFEQGYTLPEISQYLNLSENRVREVVSLEGAKTVHIGRPPKYNYGEIVYWISVGKSASQITKHFGLKGSNRNLPYKLAKELGLTLSKRPRGPNKTKRSPVSENKEAVSTHTQHRREQPERVQVVAVANTVTALARPTDVRIPSMLEIVESAGKNIYKDMGYPPILRIDFTMPRYVIELGPVQTTSAIVVAPSTAVALAGPAKFGLASTADATIGVGPRIQEALGGGRFVDFANLYRDSIHAGKHPKKVAERNAKVLAIIALGEKNLPLSTIMQRVGAGEIAINFSLNALVKEEIIERIPSIKAKRFRIRDGAFGIADVAAAIANNKWILLAQATGQVAEVQFAVKRANAQGMVVEILKENRYMRAEEIADHEKARANGISLQDIRGALKELVKQGVAKKWSNTGGKYYLKSLDSEQAAQDSSDSIEVELIPAGSIIRPEPKPHKGSQIRKNMPQDAQACNAVLIALGKLGEADVGAVAGATRMDQSKVAKALSVLQSGGAVQLSKKGYYIPDPVAEVRANVLESIRKTGSATPEEITQMTGRKKPDVVHAIATLVSDKKLARGSQGYYFIGDSPPLPRLRGPGRAVREAVTTKPVSSRLAHAPAKMQLRLLFKAESESAAVRPDVWFPVFEDSKDGLPLKDLVTVTSKGKIRFPRMYCEVVEKGREKSLDKVMITYVFVNTKGAIFGDRRQNAIEKNDVRMQLELYAGENQVTSLTRTCSRRNVPVRARELREIGHSFRVFESGISEEVPFGFSKWGQELPIEDPLASGGLTDNKKEPGSDEPAEGGTDVPATKNPEQAQSDVFQSLNRGAEA
jgi:DNA-binding transcriptional MerR regulator